MAEEHWMDALNNDPDLTPMAGDDVDELIKSTLEELEHADALMAPGGSEDRSARESSAEPEETPSEEPQPFQPTIPDIYADLTLEEEPDEEPELRQRHRLATGWRVLIYVVSVIAVSVVLALVGWQCADDVLALTKPDRDVTITVSETDTIEEISAKLKDAGLIEYTWLFEFYAWFAHAEEKIIPGTYELNNTYDYHALVNGMAGTNRIVRSVTIPEGYTCEQVFAELEQAGICRAEDLYEAAESAELDYWFLADVNEGVDNRLEGYLFPDTYEFYSVKSEEEDQDPNWVWPEDAVGDDAVRVLTKFLDNFERKFTEEMQADIDTLNAALREKMTAAGFTEEEIAAGMMDANKIVIVASLIEKETASASESATISSVIYNRLCSKDYPLLEIDASVLYALGEHKTKLTAEDLMVDSPYNTRRYPGLPIGPIANPGLDSLEAALHPEDTDYYFYALDTDGTHHFSETYTEHNQFLESLESDQ